MLLVALVLSSASLVDVDLVMTLPAAQLTMLMQ